METLSTDLMCLVLAKVPMSRSKVAMQLVRKAWQAALCSPAAHSVDTRGEDETLPYSGAVLVDGLARPSVSAGIIASLAHCTVEYDADDEDPHPHQIPGRTPASWLPAGLRSLTCNCVPWEAIPVLPRLTHLRARVYDAGDYDLAAKLPKLEWLEWHSIQVFPSHLELLAHLRLCLMHVEQYSAAANAEGGRAVGPLPFWNEEGVSQRCHVEWRQDSCQNLGNLPEGLAGQVSEVTVGRAPSAGPVADVANTCSSCDFASALLARVREFAVLEAFRLTTAHFAGPSTHILLDHVDLLPASCKRLRVGPAAQLYLPADSSRWSEWSVEPKACSDPDFPELTEWVVTRP